VLASGATAIVGFGVLVLSDIRMLRDFGLVTLIDLSVSLAGVLVVLPAALLLLGAEDGVGLRRRRGGGEGAGAGAADGEALEQPLAVALSAGGAAPPRAGEGSAQR
jgi:hypothetical protein